MKKRAASILLMGMFMLMGLSPVWGQDKFVYRKIEPNPGNAFAWRRAWVAQLTDCDRFVTDYAGNTPLPAYLVYSTDLAQSDIDWDAETITYSCEVSLYPDAGWPAPIVEAVNAVYAGLAETGQAAAWKLDWPARSASGGASEALGETNVRYSAALQLVNGRGQVVAAQTVSLSAGWKITFSGGRAAASAVQASETVAFSGVKESQITGNMTVRVASLDGAAAETAARAKQVKIMTEASYAKDVLGIEVKNGMVRIAGGTFTMGSPASEPGRDDDETQHQVTVSAFWIGQYEVTQAEYQAVMGTNPSDFKGDNRPVENVSWYDAVEYCNARSRKEGLTPAYTIRGENVTWNRSANGYRLPTEAEWEYACRAGTAGAYAGNVDDMGWYDDNSGYETHPVGQKQPNAWGLYDMHGNVWEWCWDWYGDYPRGAQTNPVGASSGNYRVLRGGSWSYGARDLRSAYRDSGTPDGRSYYFGFRLVRS